MKTSYIAVHNLPELLRCPLRPLRPLRNYSCIILDDGILFVKVISACGRVHAKCLTFVILAGSRAMHSCQSCNVTFANEKQLRHHLSSSTIHVGKQHFCEFCDVKFSTASNMHAHVRKKHIDKVDLKHECGLCQKAFDSARGLGVHQKQSRKCSVMSGFDDAKLVRDGPPKAPMDACTEDQAGDALPSQLLTLGQMTEVNEACRVSDNAKNLHSTIVFVPARGSTGQVDEDASPIERTCFIVIVMAEFFRRGHGSNTHLTVIIPRGISDEEFEAAARSLELVDEWHQMKIECVVYFDTYESLVGAFRQAKIRHLSVLKNVTSLLIIGHGGYDRCQVLYGRNTGSDWMLKRPSNLLAPKISGLIDISGAKIVHIMTCKAGKLLVSMTQTKRAIFNELHNDDTVFIAYGSEDITTVPVDISAGMF